YPINPRCYQAVIVPTFIITLNWADAVSQAHNLDAQLSQIQAKSSEGFEFEIDLQVQIHIPDTQAPYVISMVGSVPNLVNEVLQAAVGNHFRNKLQSMPAVKFISTREQVQQGAFEYVKDELAKYRVETRGVYIQAVVLPQQLVDVLTQREIANQEIETYKMQRAAQDQRTETEKAKGTADMQADLAKSQVGVNIQTNKTAARKMEAEGEATFIEQTGTAQGAQVRSVGLARAEAYERQVAALGANGTALVNSVEALSRSTTPFMPSTLVMGGGGTVDGLLALMMRQQSLAKPAA
ncbi:MAG: SPFH domain-containing protein, partial [Bryobacteraceae bacterium]